MQTFKKKKKKNKKIRWDGYNVWMSWAHMDRSSPFKVNFPSCIGYTPILILIKMKYAIRLKHLKTIKLWGLQINGYDIPTF